MSNSISFFMAVDYMQIATCNQWLTKKTDDYFYLGGKKAYVLQEKIQNGQEKVVLFEANLSSVAKFIKIPSYFTIVIPLGMLIAKSVLHSTHTFQLVDPKKELEEGMDVPEKTILKIRNLLMNSCEKPEKEANLQKGFVSKMFSTVAQIFTGYKDEELVNEVERLSNNGNTRVFKLKESPQWVFKTSSKEYIDERFQNMIKAKEICLANHLDCLVVPQAKKFAIDGCFFIVEEALDFKPEECVQQSLYSTCADRLDEPVRQIVIFITKTGLFDVTWRNIPILNDSRRIGLIDTERMGDSTEGFTGGVFGCSRGLIRCLPERQLDNAITEMRRQGAPIDNKKIESIKQYRLRELKYESELDKKPVNFMKKSV